MDNIKSQVLELPFTVNQALDNNIKNIKGLQKGIDLNQAISPSGPLNDIDKDMLINYSSKIDYVGNDSLVLGQFIAAQELVNFDNRSAITLGGCVAGCKRCTASSSNLCVECLDGFKLILGMCKKNNGNMLKLPLLNYKDRFISLKTNDLKNNFYLEKEINFTITFWIKYFGQLSTGVSSCIVLFRFTKDGTRYICYNPNEGKLYFYEGTSIIYTDATVFYNLMGQWCLISITNFYYAQNDPADMSKYFQKLQKFYVHDKEIKKIGPDLPKGWNFNTFDLGFEYSAILSDIRFFRNFILNPYAYVTGNKKDFTLQLNYQLDGKTNLLDCVTDSMLDFTSYPDLIANLGTNLLARKLGIECKGDYNPYLAGTCSSAFFNYTDIYNRDVPCTVCDKSCVDDCANNGKYDCQCDFGSANQILRYDVNATTHYCDSLPYLDFSKQSSFDVNNVKVSNTGEYSIEFWFYLYSYNPTYVAFESEEIIWDYHTYIKIFYSNNTLGLTCNPVYQSSQASNYKFYERDENMFKNIMTWVYVSCSVSVPLKRFTTQRGFSYNLDTDSKLIPDKSKLSTTTLTIRPGANSRTNYGFLFIKDLRLWSIYDINNLNTNC